MTKDQQKVYGEMARRENSSNSLTPTESTVPDEAATQVRAVSLVSTPTDTTGTREADQATIIQCDVCGAPFFNHNSLNIHITNNHASASNAMEEDSSNLETCEETNADESYSMDKSFIDVDSIFMVKEKKVQFVRKNHSHIG